MILNKNIFKLFNKRHYLNSFDIADTIEE